LCLSQRLIEQHGGELRLESSAQSGTVATLTLPQLLPTARGTPASTLAPEPTQGHGVKVLVVDDDAEVLRPLCSYLEQAGYRVSTARDGHEAIDQLRAAHTDVLLTDIGMPKMDGLELCRRAHALLPRLPVVLMSGWASDVDHAKARAVGAQALLAKPFAMQQVCDILRRMADAAGPK
jgi:CheY-like chemotaxis protein